MRNGCRVGTNGYSGICWVARGHQTDSKQAGKQVGEKAADHAASSNTSQSLANTSLQLGAQVATSPCAVFSAR